jgi:hypothetical protein
VAPAPSPAACRSTCWCPAGYRTRTSNMKEKTMIRLLLGLLMAVSASSADAQTRCPDGSYVNGTCRIMPNGSYVGSGDDIRMAPDGSYVTGQPRLAPNGKYIGGEGPMTRCPDGSYVSGQCQLTPNGHYIGR